MTGFVEVAVPVGVRKTFLYSVPRALRGKAVCGSRVLAPFGRKLLMGVIVRQAPEPMEQEFRIRPLREVLDPEPLVPEDMLETALWIAEKFFTPPGEVLRAVLPVGSNIRFEEKVELSARARQLLPGGLRPPGLHSAEYRILDTLLGEGSLSPSRLARLAGVRDVSRWIDSLVDGQWVVRSSSRGRARTSPKVRQGIRALPAGDRDPSCLTDAQRRLYTLLERETIPMPLQEVLRLADCSASVAHALARKGWAEIASMDIYRRPEDLQWEPGRTEHSLTEAQQHVLESLCSMMREAGPTRCLLHGVTGSGKTEVYLRLIEKVRKAKGSALLLVPEIGLTPMLSRIAVSYFREQVALLHSGMSPGERFDQWNRIRRGEASIVLGTRSAVFAPVTDLRLVIIDEEQDSSYKQDETPCYHARDVAWHRLQASRGLLLLGSATPSLETFHAATEAGQARLLTLTERIESRPLPEVEVVDMGLEFQRHGKKTVISMHLLHELEDRLDRGEQSLVLLNRRGFARSLVCRSCGHVFACRDCSISMTYHRQAQRLICHYCGLEEPNPSICETCRGEYVQYVGVGTEQLEQILRSLLPNARIARVDRDSMRRRGALRATLLAFEAGRLDLMVGTQMLAKGHDFPGVTLVGVVNADAGLSFPDFRAAEQSFQLLTQVAGRAGRGTTPGRVVIQSFYPDHYALQCSRRQDYAGFYGREIEFRKLMGYPPAKKLIQIMVVDPSQEKAYRIGGSVASELKRQAGRSRLQVLGPASAPLERLRGKYRVQILIKVPPDFDAIPVLEDAFSRLENSRVPMKSIHVDVDPLSVL